MVLVLQLDDVFREPTLDFASRKVLPGEGFALVPPIIVSTRFSVLPGFAPAGELVAWRIPKGATFVVEAKGANTKVSLFETNQTISALRDAPCKLTPRLASLERMDASLGRADQLASLKQGPQAG